MQPFIDIYVDIPTDCFWYILIRYNNWLNSGIMTSVDVDTLWALPVLRPVAVNWAEDSDKDQQESSVWGFQSNTPC